MKIVCPSRKKTWSGAALLLGVLYLRAIQPSLRAFLAALFSIDFSVLGRIQVLAPMIFSIRMDTFAPLRLPATVPTMYGAISQYDRSAATN